VSAAISALALPFVFLARREHASSDPIERDRDADGEGDVAAVDPARPQEVADTSG
jgi:hypothetical protein